MRQRLLSFANPAGVSGVATVRVSPKVPGEASRRFGLQMRAARRRIVTVIAQELIKITRNNFGPNGSMRPTPWPPYSKSYSRRVPGPPTLVRSGTLMNSLRFSATEKSAVIIAEGKRDYAAAQQFGYPPNRLPARPYFPIITRGGGNEVLPEAQRQIERAVDAEVQKIFGTGGSSPTSGFPSAGSLGGSGAVLSKPAKPPTFATNRQGAKRSSFWRTLREKYRK